VFVIIDAVLAWGRNKSLEFLRILDQYYLGPTKQWICGGTSPTIADYMGAAVFSAADLISVHF
jgi:glutathione S-transferase